MNELQESKSLIKILNQQKQDEEGQSVVTGSVNDELNRKSDFQQFDFEKTSLKISTFAKANISKREPLQKLNAD